MTESGTELWRGDEIAVRTNIIPGCPNLVVSFMSRAGAAKPRRGFGETFFEKNGVSGVYFLTADNTWWQSAEMAPAVAAARAAIEASGATRVSTYGSSMGGFGALTFASRLGAHNALALSPQASLYRDDLPAMGIWREEVSGTPEIERLTRESLDGVKVFLAYDPSYKFDVLHVREVERLGDVTLLPLSLAGHETAKYLLEIQMLTLLVLSICREGAPPADFVAMAKGKRKSNVQYLAGLSRRARRGSGPKTFADAQLNEMMAARIASADQTIPHRLAGAWVQTKCGKLCAAQKFDEAIEAAQLYVANFPTHIMALNNLGVTLAAAGRLPEALAAANQAVRGNRKDVRHRLLKARILLESDRIPEAAEVVESAFRMGFTAPQDWRSTVLKLVRHPIPDDAKAAAVRHALKVTGPDPALQAALAALEAATAG